MDSGYRDACHGRVFVLEAWLIRRCGHGSVLHIGCCLRIYCVEVGQQTLQSKKARTAHYAHARQALSATFAFFALAWGVTYYVLVRFTNSNVPLLDSFTNALSFVGLWALARKYVEQWLFWIVVDVVCTVLYVYKGIPFKAGLYGLYVVIAVLGYFKWKSMMKQAAS